MNTAREITPKIRPGQINSVGFAGFDTRTATVFDRTAHRDDIAEELFVYATTYVDIWKKMNCADKEI